MRPRPVHAVLLAATAIAAALASPAPADDGKAAPAAPPALSDRERAIHVLSRLAFGHCPGDIEKVLAETPRAWIERQLHPEKIPDQEIDRRLAAFESLGLDPKGLLDRYDIVAKDDTPEEQARVYRVRETPPREIASAVLLRAIYSERRLEEVMVEFWRNHFNVSLNKDAVRFLGADWEREVIRKHVFGRFEDMLLASAKHPAMLIYLDNVLSQRPLTEQEARSLARAGRKKGQRLLDLERQRGLNENYARELLELHTLGVDNGYTQRDVTELARVLTGWTVDPRPEGRYGFWFRAEAHDPHPKQVLQWPFGKNGGVEEGETVIRGLARHKGTARFIAWKLCRYLVADAPPEDLVERVAQVFRKTGGDLRETTRAVVLDEAFFDPAHARAKFKTPFEFVVSALRATSAEVTDAQPLLEALARMGQPVYHCDDPTGYYDTAEAWLDPGVLALRWQFALSLSERAKGPVHIPAAFFERGGRGGSVAAWLPGTIVPGGVGPTTARVLARAVRETGGDPAALRRRLTAMLLGSPEFQKQ